MFNAYTGKPRAGKSRVATELIVDELRLGNRCIVTSVPLRFDPWVNGKGKPQIGLLHYLRRTYDGKDFNARERIRVLTEEECKHFFIHRGRGVDCELIYDGKGKKVGRPTAFDTAAVTDGVYYLIDEAWKYFDARNWQDTDEAIRFYAAQHAKFGDDVAIITQNLPQIDKSLVRLCQDFSVIENQGNMSWGPFRRPTVIKISVYASPPDKGSTPMNVYTRIIDTEGLAQCYDTSAGAGINGRFSADMGSRKKGKHWIWLVLLAIFVIWFALKIPGLLKTHLVDRFFAGGKASQEQRLVLPSNGVPVAVAAPPRTFAESFTDSIKRATGVGTQRETALNREGESRVRAEEPEQVYLTGYARSGTNVWIYLSDGSYYTQRDPRLRFVGDEFVIIEGKAYRFKPLRSDFTQRSESDKSNWQR